MSARIAVHVQPRAKRTEVVGTHGAAVKIRLAAPPVDGAANEEVIALFSKALGVPRRAVTVAVGERSTRKQIDISGRTRADVERLLGAS